MPDPNSTLGVLNTADSTEESVRKMREFLENTKPSKEAQAVLDDFSEKIKDAYAEIGSNSGFGRVDARIDELEKMLMAHIYRLDDRILELEHGKSPPQGGVGQ